MSAPPRVGRGLVLAIAIGPTAFFVTLAALVHSCFYIPPPDRLPAADRDLAVRALRNGLAGALDEGSLASLDGRSPRTVVAVLWRGGAELARVVGDGPSLAAAIRDAAGKFGEYRLDAQAVDRSRISVDIVGGSARFAGDLPLLSLFALSPGVDGLRGRIPDGRVAYVLPLDLLRANLLTAAAPLEFIPDLKMGVDLAAAEALAAVRLGLSPSAWREADVVIERIRTDAFVEAVPELRDSQPPAQLFRGVPERPPLSSQALREGALAGGRFLVNHLAPSGRYIYEVELGTGRATDPKKPRPYSLPRHAGTTYFLAELYRLTGEPFLREPIERAFAHLGELVEAGGCGGTSTAGARWACVVDAGAGRASLGSTALTVVALLEYRRATGRATYDELTDALVEFLLFMQRPDGSFAHVYEVVKGVKDDAAHMLYFSGEAALALARAYAVHGEPRVLEATRRALDHLIGFYDFFVGGLFYGEEHWTCIAAEAIWPHLKDDRYRAFCDGYGGFLRLQQPELGDFASAPDLAGTYGFTPFVVPANTPAGSRTEAMISAYLLGVRHGKPSAALRRQVIAAMHFALGQQITEESAFWMVSATDPVGGVPASPVEPSVRIDYVQHVCSAMIRAAVLLEEVPSGKADREVLRSGQ